MYVSLSAGGGFSVAGGVTGLVEGGCSLDGSVCRWSDRFRRG